MLTPLRKRIMNHRLQLNGLATLDQPRELLEQLALGIRSHDDFRKLLLTVEPDKRQDCYQSLCGRLSFEAKPLEDYIIEGKQIAENRQLPEWDDITKQIKDHGSAASEAACNRAVAKAAADAQKMPNLVLECRRCTKIEAFRAVSRRDAWKSAKEVGWKQEKLGLKVTALCPACAPPTVH